MISPVSGATDGYRRGKPDPSDREFDIDMMKQTIIAVAAVTGLSLGIAGCSTTEGAVSGGVIGAALGGLGTNSVGGAIIGAGIGALAGAVLVEHLNNGWCTYRYKGKLYRDRCYR